MRKYLKGNKIYGQLEDGSKLHVGQTNLSFSMDEGIETSLLFLRSSHLKLGQLVNSESGRAVNLLPSR